MKIIRYSERPNPQVSLVLLDWSVRESFHLLHYLSKQTVNRNDFEVLVIEYYSRVSNAVQKYEDQVDTWVVLEMPESCYYHKHLMYNVGIVLSRGDIVMIGDSDTMVRETFVESIIKHYERDPEIVCHIDQFRNERRDFYPFNFPSFEQVLGDGCINNTDAKTTGVLDTKDPIHSRNYGACMCARRKDLIAIGGADEYMDYLGHICGPYDMTFRLINYGRREIWDMNEFMYHTWHPGQAGTNNYFGPHDGRHMSTTAMWALVLGRVQPLLENEAVRLLRTDERKSAQEVLDKLIDSRFLDEWHVDFIKKKAKHPRWSGRKIPLCVYRGFRLVAEVDRVFAFPVIDTEGERDQGHKAPFQGMDIEETKRRIDAAIPLSLKIAGRLACYGGLLLNVILARYDQSKQSSGGFSDRIQLPVSVLLSVFAGLFKLAVRPRESVDNLSNIKKYLTQLSSAPGNLAMTLYNLKMWSSLVNGDEQPFVLTGSRHAISVLRVLGWLGLVPRVKARCVVNMADLERCLNELKQDEKQYRLILPSDLYVRFYSIMVSSPAPRRMVVV